MSTWVISQKIKAVLRQYAPRQIKSRGKDIFGRGGVKSSDIEWDEGISNFRVVGNSEYTVTVKFKLGPTFEIINFDCECPYPGMCKHTVAALLSLKDEYKYFESGRKRTKWNSDNSGGKSTSSEKKIATRKRSSSDPYIIPIPKELTNDILTDHCTPQSRQPYGLDVIRWQVAAGGIILVEGTDRYTYSGGIEVVAIKMSSDEEEISVTCTCKRNVSKLCTHGYSAIYQFLLPQKGTHKNVFQRLEKKEIEKFVRERSEEYGVPFTKDWQDNFELKVLKDGYDLKPKGKFAGMINPHLLSENLIKTVSESKPENELYSASSELNTYQTGFCFFFRDEKNFIDIRPLVGKLKKNSHQLAKSIKHLDETGFDTEINFLPEDHQSIDNIRKLLDRNLLLTNKAIAPKLFGLLKDIVSSIQGHPRIYVNGENRYYRTTIPKSHLTPIQLIDHSPKVKILFEEEGDLIYGRPHIEFNGELFPFESREVTQQQFYFVQCSDHLFLHSSIRDAETFNVFFQNPEMSSTVAKFPMVIDEFWSKLSNRHELNFEKISSYSMEELGLESAKKELYLSDLENHVIFKPVVVYNDDTRLEALSSEDPVKIADNKVSILKRNRDFEDDFIKQLRSLHPTFEKLQRNDFFHLSYEQFLDDRWFLKVFPKLKEYGIEVLGWKDLKKFNVNPNPATVSFTFNQRTDWFEAEADVVFGDSRITLDEIKKQITPDGYVKLDDGTLGILPEQWLSKFGKMFRHGEVKDNKLRISTKLFSLVDELFEEIDNEEIADFIREKKEKLLNFDQIQKQSLPRGIQATLRHYQEDGYNWLCFLDEFQWGGILADDMGLGKTVQVITFLKKVLTKNKQTNLVIVPTSLLFNWENELKKFAPTIKAYFHYGNDRVKDPDVFDKHQIVITSYGLMTRDIEFLKEYQFNYIILDESQAIKNPASKRYKAARLLKANNRITLTGTPIENNTFDLYAQLSFLNPGLLGSAANFKKVFAKAIDEKRDSDKAAELQKIINPFVLRRTKEQVATELPDKIEDILYCEMKTAQRKVYDAYRNKYRKMIVEKIEEDGLAKSRFSMLEGLTKLRQICDSPEILSGDEVFEGTSAKVEVLMKHIVEKTGNHKILIFSQFVKMLKVIEGQIQAEGIDYEYLDGKSSRTERQKSVESFHENEDCRVFLISLKAGGTGLNLIAADYVYLVDPWWNPAVENQAIDRCYRIGQDKKVIAYRMICKNSVEEKILDLQNKKKAVASDVITTDENVLKQLVKKDIIELFG